MRKRRRGQGSVFYSATEKVWVARVPLGVVNGKRVRRKARGRTRELALAALDRLQRKYRGGNPSTDTLDGYLVGWLEQHRANIAPSTYVSYAGHVEKHISPLLGGMLMVDIQPSDVRRLITNLLASGLSPSTTGRVITTLRIALRQAFGDRAIPDEPTAGVQLPRVTGEPVRALSAQDVRDILAAVRGDPLEGLYVLLLGSGIRLGEACALDWRDVDLDAGIVLVRRSKAKRPRSVGITPYAAAALRAHRGRSKRVGVSEPVFLGPRSNERLEPGTASHAFPRLLDRAGLRRMRVHDLRHGMATRMLAHGVPMRVIADQLGHRNPALTARVYAHVLPEAQRSAVDILESDASDDSGSRIGSRSG